MLEINEIIAHSHGDWTMAREFSNQGLEISPEELFPLIRRALLEYEVGDKHQGESYLDRLWDTSNKSAIASNTIGVLAVPIAFRLADIPSRFQFSEEKVDRILAMPSTPRWQTVLLRAALGFAAIDRGDVHLAHQQYTVLISHRSTYLRYVNICIDRLLGLLARITNSTEKATSHFEDAYAFCREAGYRPELAWTCHDHKRPTLDKEHGKRGKGKNGK